MSDFVILCKKGEVTEGHPIQVMLEKVTPLGVYKYDGNYYVVSDICTHGMAFMTEGEQDGNEIECPFHGGAFNLVTGEVLSMPCNIPLKTYPVIIEVENVCIDKSSL